MTGIASRRGGKMAGIYSLLRYVVIGFEFTIFIWCYCDRVLGIFDDVSHAQSKSKDFRQSPDRRNVRYFCSKRWP